MKTEQRRATKKNMTKKTTNPTIDEHTFSKINLSN